MKQLKRLFVATMTAITVLVIFLIADVVLVGAISLVAMLFSKAVAADIFKWGLITLFSIELVLTIPATIKTINKGDYEEYGS